MKSEYIWNPLYVKVMNILEVYKGTSKKFEEICKEVDKKFLEYINVVQYGNLCLFKYSQFNEAIYTIEYVKEARSVVIDIETGELIMCPFKKFFNVNEYEESKESEVERLISQADKIEFSDKLDGSFQQARWKNGIFYYSGSGTLDPEKSYQLKEGYLLFINDLKLKRLVKDYSDWTVIFEAILEDDKHVVQYKGNSLKLIGMRNVYTGELKNYDELINISKQYGIESTTLEDVSFNIILSLRDKYKANEKEGWVCHLKVGNKDYQYKIKCSDYLIIHGLISSLTNANIVIKAKADGKYDDLLGNVPQEYVDRVKNVGEVIDYFVNLKAKLINYYYSLVNNENDKKQFALAVNEKVPKEFKSYMFNLRQKKEFNLLKRFSNTNCPSYISYENIKEFINKYQ